MKFHAFITFSSPTIDTLVDGLNLVRNRISDSEVSTGEDFLSCPALSCFLPSSWRVAGQDKNKKTRPVLQDRTGHQDRLSCAQL